MWAADLRGGGDFSTYFLFGYRARYIPVKEVTYSHARGIFALIIELYYLFLKKFREVRNPQLAVRNLFSFFALT